MSLRFFLIITVFSLLLFAYPVWRTGQWLGLDTYSNLLVTLPAFFSQFATRLLLRHSTHPALVFLKRLIDLFLGFAPVLLALVLVGELVLALSAIPSSTVAVVILVAGFVIGLAGMYAARVPRVVEVALSSHKISRPLRFAQISDVHIGSRTSRFLDRVMRTVASLDTDFLCITGDLIDQPDVSLKQLEALGRFNRPVYYCTGNHERYEDFDRIIERLEALGVHVLRNRHLDANGVQIIGIDDADDKNQVGNVLPSIQVDQNRYSILLYHRPQGIEAAHAHGVDLQLSGHTHKGQIVPFNLLVKRVYEYTQGLYRHMDTLLYVNEGTGTWGPTMRLGTRGEITLFELRVTATER